MFPIQENLYKVLQKLTLAIYSSERIDTDEKWIVCEVEEKW